MDTPRADHEFLRQIREFLRQFEDHMHSRESGYARTTAETKVRGAEYLVRWLSGEDIRKGRTGR